MSFFVTLAIYIALFALSELLRPKPKLENARPAGLGDFDFPTATEDRKVPIGWGTFTIEGPNVVWYGDLQQTPISVSVKTGLFSKKRQTIGFRYNVGIQFALCRGEATLYRVWIGDTVVLDEAAGIGHNGIVEINRPNLFGGDQNGSGGVVCKGRFYAGTTTQTLDPYLQTHQSIGGSFVGYRRTAQVVFKTEATLADGSTAQQPGYIGNSTSLRPWRFELRRAPNLLGLAAGGLVNGKDANLANVVYEILTDTEWGLGLPSADINVLNFQAAGATLAAEGNGFSFVMTSALEAHELLREVERQMDGVVYLNQSTGLWEIKLARADYVLANTPLVDNPIEVRDPVQQTWLDTSNVVIVPFYSRALDYKKTSAGAQDMGNVRIQNRVVPVTISYPGVKDDALADQLAWRDLRTHSTPLKKATLIVDRSYYAVTVGSVVRVTVTRLNWVQVPMRVQGVDHGELRDNKIALNVVEDVFRYAVGGFGGTPDTRWDPPADNLSPFAKTAIFESPRGFLIRDPELAGSLSARLWATGERQGPEVGFELWYDTAALPAYVLGGTILAAMRVGTLAAALNRGSSPVASLTVNATTQAEKTAVLAAAVIGATLADLGQDLVHLLQIGDEFLLVQTITSAASLGLTFANVYRGVLDSVQQDHVLGADVRLLFIGGGHSDATFDESTAVDVKLLPYSLSDKITLGEVTPVSVTMAARALKPYPPARLSVNGTQYPSTGSLEGVGSGDTLGFDVVLTRRDFRTTDELVALTTDAATLFGDFPTANTTEHQVEVRNDPAGANTLLLTITWQASATFSVLRRKVLRATDGVLPTTLGIVATARHVVDGTTRTSRVDLKWAFSVTTGLTGQFNFGALDNSETSNLYTATVTGQYDFTLGTALATGGLEYRLNGGAWTAMAGGGTSWNIPTVTNGDTVEIRHTSTTSGTETFLQMAAAGAGQDGYAVLFRP